MRGGTWPSRQGKGDLKRRSHCGGKLFDHRSRLGGMEVGVAKMSNEGASHM